jgi:hypothetical protein
MYGIVSFTFILLMDLTREYVGAFWPIYLLLAPPMVWYAYGEDIRKWLAARNRSNDNPERTK